jgi:hypothetical protein
MPLGNSTKIERKLKLFDPKLNSQNVTTRPDVRLTKNSKTYSAFICCQLPLMFINGCNCSEHGLISYLT